MTTSELIKELQKLDPTGNSIVNGVYFCEKLPYYYDGKSYDINRNDSTNNKLKLTIGRKDVGKINIHIFGIDDICDFYGYDKEEILENIDLSWLSEKDKIYYLNHIDNCILKDKNE